MDGNGRWAKKRGLPRLAGHHQGKITLEKIGDEVRRLGIKYLTVYAFSAENWLRPKEEVSGLMNLLEEGVQQHISTFIKQGIRLRFIGDFSQVNPSILKIIKKAEAQTQHLDQFNFTIAFSYGSRQEVVQAVQDIGKKLLKKELSLQEISEETISKSLYTHDLPDPDLIIRTSGEYRLSNFLMWQSSYSELFFVEKYWPDFTPKDLRNVLLIYQQRERRYGKISEQL
jgi:undecaprenyl diphosphate synthase